MTQNTIQTVLFEDLFFKPVVASFDQADSSSDGGAILLKGIDSQLQLTHRLAACITDRRQEGKIIHTVEDLLRQRVYGIACGYSDCNDAGRLASDPIQKLLLDRDPLEGKDLGSQPSLSRFENSVTSKDLFRIGMELADIVVTHHAKRLKGKCRKVTIDLDPTDDPTHGQQQLSLFNGHYQTHCYLPMVGMISFDEEGEQHTFTSVLRAGNAPAAKGALSLLRRILDRVKEHFPSARVLVRLDGGFASPVIFDWLEEYGVDFVVAMAGNPVLERRARKLMGKVRMLSKASGKTETLYGETLYAAKTWSHRRRIIMKAEVVRYPGREMRDNERFVVTNLKVRPEQVYDIYRLRGNAENRIKELHYGVEVDRTSCTRFLANQFRVLMATAGYVMMQEMRRLAAGTECAQAQVTTMRERLLKLGVWVERSVRRIVLHLPRHYPWLNSWRQIAIAVGITV